MEEPYPDTSGPEAREGTAAHELADETLRAGFTEVSAYLDSLNGMHPNEWNYDLRTMGNYVQRYIDYVLGLKGHRFHERRVHYDRWVKDGSGSADYFVISRNGKRLTVVDLKYGYDKVYAERNPQGSLYAAGVMQDFGFMLGDDLEEIVIVIVMPRHDFIDEWHTTPEELTEWLETVAAPGALLTEDPDAPLVPSSKACQWCKARFDCRARADAVLSAATAGFTSVLDTEPDMTPRSPMTLTPKEKGHLLKLRKLIKNFIGDLEEDAKAMLEKGDEVPDWKLVAGNRRRTYKNEKRARRRLIDRFGIDVAAPRVLVTAPAAETLHKDGDEWHRFEEEEVQYNPGGPILVPDTDRREALVFKPTAGFKSQTDETGEW